LDQGTMVPLYFLNQIYRDYRLVRIGLSGFPLTMHYQLGEYVRTVAEHIGRRWMFVASGDLSHCQKADGPYGFHPEGPEYDERIMHTMGTGSFGELLNYNESFLNKAQECGHRSFTILAGSLDSLSVRPQVISHEATLGVGYGVVLYDIGSKDSSRNFLTQYLKAEEKEIAEKKSDAYVQLARSSVTSWVKNHRALDVSSELPEEMKKEKAGVFVSIHEHGELRGCIGTTEPSRKNIAAEIIHNAISACSRDPRFDPITEDELPYLDISVDVLKEPEPIASKADLDVKKYGVICSSQGRRGLLLPDLDGVDTVEEQISIACRKGGIDPDHDPVKLERFEVVRHV
ncbi:MAG: AmmeMemoRadiSam system protein A, partial [Bulleidia sp.]